MKFDLNIPLVSVVIPCFNVERYVVVAVDSILNQTHENLEIFLVDDGSTDGTLDLLTEYLEDSRVKLIKFDINQKKIRAVNSVLAEVNGDYIVFQDADDWSEPNRIELQLDQFLKDSELGVCYVGHKLHKRDVVYTPNNLAKTDEELKSIYFNFHPKSESGLVMPVCAGAMIARSVVYKTKGYNIYFAGRVGEDIYWHYKILREFKGVTVDMPLYNYLERENSLTNNQFRGANVKSSYSWYLLSKLISYELKHDLNLLDQENSLILNRVELEACEDALVDVVKDFHQIKTNFEKSYSYRLGSSLLMPYRWFCTVLNLLHIKQN